MKLKPLKVNNLNKFIGGTKFLMKKKSPEILLGLGIGGYFLAGGLAVRSAIKYQVDITDDYLYEKEQIEREIANNPDYTKEERAKDIRKLYLDTAGRYVVAYGPAVTLALAATVSVLAGHRIIKQRNLALAAAYKTLESSFNYYRNRVKEEEGGEERDYMYINGLRKETVEVDEVNAKGKVKKTVISKDPTAPSMYARIFDESCVGLWSPNPEDNLITLRNINNYHNDRLKINRHVLLNEVYDSLGMPRTSAGAAVGWVSAKYGGDGFIDFGLYDLDNPRTNAFINGEENVVLLDFNVDGEVWHYIDEPA